MESKVGDVEPDSQEADLVYSASFACFSNVVLHCDEVATSDEELEAWGSLFARIFLSNPNTASKFLAQITPKKDDTPLPPVVEAKPDPVPAVVVDAMPSDKALDDFMNDLEEEEEEETAEVSESFIASSVLQVRKGLIPPFRRSHCDGN